MLENMTTEGLIDALVRRWGMELERTLEGVVAPRAALTLYQLERRSLFERIERTIGKEMARLMESHPAFADKERFAEAFVGLILEADERRGRR